MGPRLHRAGRALVVLALGAAATDCRRVRALFENQQVSYVDAPTTLDAVRARRSARERVFLRKGDGAWEEHGVPPPRRDTQGGARGLDSETVLRGALVLTELCLVGGCAVLPFLPVFALASALGERQEAVVQRDGRAVYFGVFDVRGRFLYARVREGDTVRDLARLQLPELGQEPLVEVGRMAALPDGGVGRATRTPIDPQAHLLAQYRAALARRDADDRADLLVEALRWLGDEALPLAVERVTDASAPAVLTAVCRDRAHAPPRGTPSLAFAHAPLLAAVAAQPTGDAVRVALGCDPPAPTRAALRDALTRTVCTDDDAGATLEAALSAGDAPEARRAWVASTRCEGPRGVLLGALAGRATSADALAQAFAAERSHSLRVAVLTRLDPAVASHRAALFGLAPRHPSALVALAATEVTPTRDEVTSVVRGHAAASFPTTREAMDRARSAELDALAARHGGGFRLHGEHLAQSAAEDLLARASGDADARAAATRAIDAVVAEARLDDRRSRVKPLRIALGAPLTLDDFYVGEYDLRCRWRDGVPDLRLPDGWCPVAYALWTRGCTEEDFRRVHAAVRQRSAPPACSQAPPWPRPPAARAQWTRVTWP